MNQDTTPEQLIQDARDRGKVLRCSPSDAPQMDFVTVGRVMPGKWAGIVAGDETAHIYDTADVKNYVENAMPSVFKVSQENTRWGKRKDGAYND